MWIRVILLLVAGYVGLVLFAQAMAGGMIHHPQMGSRRAPAGLLKIPDGKGGEIAVLHLPNPGARHTLWYFHGNAEDLGDIEPTLRSLRDAGFAVFAADYPGYGLSSGRPPSERKLYESSRIARKYLRETLRVPADRTIVYGRSLGGGPALQMAVEERMAGVILHATFVSAYRVMTRWRLLPMDPFQNLGKIGRIRCPLLVMHGQQDRVIPPWHGEKLFAAAAEPRRILRVAGAGHNDLRAVAGPSYLATLRQFNELCARPAAAAP